MTKAMPRPGKVNLRNILSKREELTLDVQGLSYKEKLDYAKHIEKRIIRMDFSRPIYYFSTRDGREIFPHELEKDFHKTATTLRYHFYDRRVA